MAWDWQVRHSMSPEVLKQYDELAALISDGRVSHSRVGERLWRGMLLVYLRAHESPTGCLLWDAVPDIPMFADLLRGALSPLSPQESR